MTILRNYQQQAFDHLQQRIGQGASRLYVTLPTGTGKSVLLSTIAQHRLQQGRVLVLTHRQDLALQLARTIQEDEPAAGLLMQGHRDLDASLVVATLPSLVASLTDLIAGSDTPLRTLLIDEAHHAVPGSVYESILTTVEAQDDHPSVVTIGFTATPYRSDTQRMSALLPTCAFAREIPEMVQAGWLTPLTWVPLPLDLNLSSVPTTLQDGEADYSQESLTRAMVRLSLTEAIVQQAAPKLQRRPTLVFALTVEHAEQFAATFRQHGFSAAVVSGRMSQAQRERLYADWRDGVIQIVCNCTLLTEGFDFPSIAALLIARPTRSPSLYVQMLGRGMRTAPGKKDCLVIDVLGNHPDLTHQMAFPHIVGVSTPQEETLLSGRQTPPPVASDPLLTQILGAEVENGLSLLDPVGQSPYRWSTYRGGYFSMVSADEAVIMERDPTGSGLYHSRLYTMKRGEPSHHEWIERDYLPLREHVALVHDATAAIFRITLSGKEAAWLQEPASEKQLAALQRWHPRFAKRAREVGWTKGTVSLAINFCRLAATLRHPPTE